jgi:hypothetical protein
MTQTGDFPSFSPWKEPVWKAAGSQGEVSLFLRCWTRGQEPMGCFWWGAAVSESNSLIPRRPAHPVPIGPSIMGLTTGSMGKVRPEF